EGTAGGTVEVEDSEISTSGPAANSTRIVDGAGAQLCVLAINLKLSGTGDMKLVAGSRVIGDALDVANTLENYDNTIFGAGTIGKIGRAACRARDDKAGIAAATEYSKPLVMNSGNVIDKDRMHG